jgi:hypothetical protein
MEINRSWSILQSMLSKEDIFRLYKNLSNQNNSLLENVSEGHKKPEKKSDDDYPVNRIASMKAGGGGEGGRGEWSEMVTIWF